MKNSIAPLNNHEHIPQVDEDAAPLVDGEPQGALSQAEQEAVIQEEFEVRYARFRFYLAYNFYADNIGTVEIVQQD